MNIKHQNRKLAFVSWDFKESPKWRLIKKIIGEFEFQFDIFDIDSQSDECYILITGEAMTAAQAQALYDQCCEEDLFENEEEWLYV